MTALKTTKRARAKPANARRNAGKSTRRKTPRTAWKPGQSGNPAGKRPGTRNRATALAQALLEGQVEEIVGQVVKAALKGNIGAAKLCLERILPPARERPISLPVTFDVATAADVNAAASTVFRAACAGDLLPSEAAAMAGILETRRRAIETEVLERRVGELEERLLQPTARADRGRHEPS